MKHLNRKIYHQNPAPTYTRGPYSRGWSCNKALSNGGFFFRWFYVKEQHKINNEWAPSCSVSHFHSGRRIHKMEAIFISFLKMDGGVPHGVQLRCLLQRP